MTPKAKTTFRALSSTLITYSLYCLVQSVVHDFEYGGQLFKSQLYFLDTDKSNMHSKSEVSKINEVLLYLTHFSLVSG